MTTQTKTTSPEPTKELVPEEDEWSWFGWLWWSWACVGGILGRVLPFFSLAWMYLTTTFAVLTTQKRQEANLKEWLTIKVPTHTVNDLTHDLADGVILCGLMEALVPGTCPRHDLLPHDQPSANLRLASRLASAYLGVKQDVTDIGGKCDIRWTMIQFLKAVRYAALRRQLLGGLPVTPDTVAQTLGDHQVLARGMGLQMAVVGRKATFNLYLTNEMGLDMVVEVKSEIGDYCSHHITNRSSSRSRHPSSKNLKERHNIPLEYEVTKSEVRVAWIPLQQSRHTLSIIWRGQHILGSPYSVTVDQSQHNSPGPRRQIIRSLHEGNGETEDLPSTLANPLSKTAVGSVKGRAGALRFMSILRRRVVRRVVHVGGEDVVLKGNESIGFSSRARKAFQRMRTISNESCDDEASTPRSHDPDTASKASPKYVDGKIQNLNKISPSGAEGSGGETQSSCKHEKPYKELGQNNSANTITNLPKGLVQINPHEIHAEAKVSQPPKLQQTLPDHGIVDNGDFKKSNTILNSSSEQECKKNSDNKHYGEREVDDQYVAETVTPEASVEANEAPCQDNLNSSVDNENLHSEKMPNLDSQGNVAKRIKKKVSKGITASSEQHFDQCCSKIVNMCEFIIEHSPKKDALKTLEVAAHIMNYTFNNDVSESSYSLPTTESNANEYISDNDIINSSDAGDDDIVLESVVDEQGNVLSVSLGSGEADEADGENTNTSETFDSDEEMNSPVTEYEVDKIAFDNKKTLNIPEVTVEDINTEISADDNEIRANTDICLDTFEVNENMDYLQTIDEETEPSSMCDDDHWVGELETCEELPELSDDVAQDKEVEHPEVLLLDDNSLADESKQKTNETFSEDIVSLGKPENTLEDALVIETTSLDCEANKHVEISNAKHKVIDIHEPSNYSQLDMSLIDTLEAPELECPTTTSNEPSEVLHETDTTLETFEADINVKDNSLSESIKLSSHLDQIENKLICELPVFVAPVTEPVDSAALVDNSSDSCKTSELLSEAAVKSWSSGGTSEFTHINDRIHALPKLGSNVDGHDGEKILDRENHVKRQDSLVNTLITAFENQTIDNSTETVHHIKNMGVGYETSVLQEKPSKDELFIAPDLVPNSTDLKAKDILVSSMISSVAYETSLLNDEISEAIISDVCKNVSQDENPIVASILMKEGDAERVSKESPKAHESKYQDVVVSSSSLEILLSENEKESKCRIPLESVHNKKNESQEILKPLNRNSHTNMSKTEEGNVNASLSVTSKSYLESTNKEVLKVGFDNVEMQESMTGKIKDGVSNRKLAFLNECLRTEHPDTAKSVLDSKDQFTAFADGSQTNRFSKDQDGITQLLKSEDDREDHILNSASYTLERAMPFTDTSQNSNAIFVSGSINTSQTPSPVSQEVAYITSSQKEQDFVISKNCVQNTDNQKELYFIPIERPSEIQSSIESRKSTDHSGNYNAEMEDNAPVSVSKFKSLFESNSIHDISSLHRAKVPKGPSLDEKAGNRAVSYQVASLKKSIECPSIDRNAKGDLSERVAELQSLTNTQQNVSDMRLEKETAKPSNKKIYPAPVISPDMSVLSQYRVGQGTEDDKPLSTQSEIYQEKSTSPVLQSIRNQPLSPVRTSRLSYTTYVKPSMIVLDSEKRVSRLRSVFESSAPKVSKSFSQKHKKFIVQGDELPHTPEYSENKLGDIIDSVQHKATETSGVTEESIKTPSSSKLGYISSETTQDPALILEKVLPSLNTINAGEGELVSWSRADIIPDNNSEQEIKGLKLCVDDVQDGESVKQTDKDTNTITSEDLTSEQFALQRKGRKLVNTLENMEKDIKEMQLCVKRLNEHYPLASESETSSPLSDADQQVKEHSEMLKEQSSVSQRLSALDSSSPLNEESLEGDTGIQVYNLSQHTVSHPESTADANIVFEEDVDNLGICNREEVYNDGLKYKVPEIENVGEIDSVSSGSHPVKVNFGEHSYKENTRKEMQPFGESLDAQNVSECTASSLSKQDQKLPICKTVLDSNTTTSVELPQIEAIDSWGIQESTQTKTENLLEQLTPIPLNTVYDDVTSGHSIIQTRKAAEEGIIEQDTSAFSSEVHDTLPICAVQEHAAEFIGTCSTTAAVRGTSESRPLILDLQEKDLCGGNEIIEKDIISIFDSCDSVASVQLLQKAFVIPTDTSDKSPDSVQEETIASVSKIEKEDMSDKSVFLKNMCQENQEVIFSNSENCDDSSNVLKDSGIAAKDILRDDANTSMRNIVQLENYVDAVEEEKVIPSLSIHQKPLVEQEIIHKNLYEDEQIKIENIPHGEEGLFTSFQEQEDVHHKGASNIIAKESSDLIQNYKGPSILSGSLEQNYPKGLNKQIEEVKQSQEIIDYRGGLDDNSKLDELCLVNEQKLEKLSQNNTGDSVEIINSNYNTNEFKQKCELVILNDQVLTPSNQENCLATEISFRSEAKDDVNVLEGSVQLQQNLLNEEVNLNAPTYLDESSYETDKQLSFQCISDKTEEHPHSAVADLVQFFDSGSSTIQVEPLVAPSICKESHSETSCMYAENYEANETTINVKVQEDLEEQETSIENDIEDDLSQVPSFNAYFSITQDNDADFISLSQGTSSAPASLQPYFDLDDETGAPIYLAVNSNDRDDSAVEELEEHGGSPWSLLTKITELISSRSASPLDNFVEDYLVPSDLTDEDSSLVAGITERINKEKDLTSSDDTMVDLQTKQDKGSDLSLVDEVPMNRGTFPPTSLSLSKINLPQSASKGSPADEPSELDTSETITSPMYEEAVDYVIDQTMSPDYEDAQDFQVDVCKSNVESSISEECFSQDYHTKPYEPEKTQNGISEVNIFSDNLAEVLNEDSQKDSQSINIEDVKKELNTSELTSTEPLIKETPPTKDDDISDSDDDYSFGTEDTGDPTFIPQSFIDVHCKAKTFDETDKSEHLLVEEYKENTGDVQISSHVCENNVVEYLKSDSIVMDGEDQLLNEMDGTNAIVSGQEILESNEALEKKLDAKSSLSCVEAQANDDEVSDSDDDYCFGSEDTGDFNFIPQSFIDEQLKAKEMTEKIDEVDNLSSEIVNENIIDIKSTVYSNDDAEYSTSESTIIDDKKHLDNSGAGSTIGISGQECVEHNIMDEKLETKSSLSYHEEPKEDDSVDYILGTKDTHSKSSEKSTSDACEKRSHDISVNDEKILKSKTVSRESSEDEQISDSSQTAELDYKSRDFNEDVDADSLDILRNTLAMISKPRMNPPTISGETNYTYPVINEDLDQESSCESDSEDDMRLGPIKGCRPLLIPLSPSPCKSPGSDDESSQSESDVTTDEDDIEISGAKPRAKYTRPAHSHRSKLHTIHELSEDEEEEVTPVRPPRLRKLSVGRRKPSDGKGPDSPRCGNRSGLASPNIGKNAPEFSDKSDHSTENTSCQKISEESEDNVFWQEEEPIPMKSDSLSSKSPSSSSDSDECDDDKTTYGRCYMKGTFLHPQCDENIQQKEDCDSTEELSKDGALEVTDKGEKLDLPDSSVSNEQAIDTIVTNPPDLSLNNKQPSVLIASESSVLHFDNTSSFYPPMETLLIPANAVPVELDALDCQEGDESLLMTGEESSKPLKEPEEKPSQQSKYVITPLGEKSVLTPHTFVPPMEMLLIPNIQESHESKDTQELTFTHGADDADSTFIGSERQETNDDEQETIVTEMASFKEDSIQDQELSIFTAKPIAVRSEVITKADSVTLSHNVESTKAGKENHQLVDNVNNKISIIKELHMESVNQEMSSEVHIESHCKENILLEEGVSEQENTEALKFDWEWTTDPQNDCILHEKHIEEDYNKFRIETRKDANSLNVTIETTDAVENLKNEVTLSKEQLTFFQSGGLQRLTSSFGVLDASEMEQVKEASDTFTVTATSDPFSSATKQHLKSHPWFDDPFSEEGNCTNSPITVDSPCKAAMQRVGSPTQPQDYVTPLKIPGRDKKPDFSEGASVIPQALCTEAVQELIPACPKDSELVIELDLEKSKHFQPDAFQIHDTISTFLQASCGEIQHQTPIEISETSSEELIVGVNTICEKSAYLSSECPQDAYQGKPAVVSYILKQKPGIASHSEVELQSPFADSEQLPDDDSQVVASELSEKLENKTHSLYKEFEVSSNAPNEDCKAKNMAGVLVEESLLIDVAGEDDKSLAFSTQSDSQSSSQPSVHWDTHPGFADTFCTDSQNKNIAFDITPVDLQSDTFSSQNEANVNTSLIDIDDPVDQETLITSSIDRESINNLLDLCYGNLVSDRHDEILMQTTENFSEQNNFNYEFFNPITKLSEEESSKTSTILTNELLGIGTIVQYSQQDDAVNLMDDDLPAQHLMPICPIIPILDIGTQSDLCQKEEASLAITKDSCNQSSIKKELCEDLMISDKGQEKVRKNSLITEMVANEDTSTSATNADSDFGSLCTFTEYPEGETPISIKDTHDLHKEIEKTKTITYSEALDSYNPIYDKKLGQTSAVTTEISCASTVIWTNSDHEHEKAKIGEEKEEVDKSSKENTNDRNNLEINHTSVDRLDNIYCETLINDIATSTTGNNTSICNEKDSGAFEEDSGLRNFLYDCLNSQVSHQDGIHDEDREIRSVQELEQHNKTESNRDEVYEDSSSQEGKESESDTLMVTAKEDEPEQSESLSLSLPEKDNTLSEVSSSVFEGLKDYYPPLNPLVSEKLSALEHIPDFFSESSESNDPLKYCENSNDGDNQSETAGNLIDYDEHVCSVSSEQTNIVLGEFQQMLDEEGSIASTITDNGNDIIADDEQGLDCASGAVSIAIKYWEAKIPEAASSGSSSLQYDTCYSTPPESIGSHHNTSLLEEIHEYRTHSNTSPASGDETVLKADARYDGITHHYNPNPSTNLVTSRKNFWDSMVTNNNATIRLSSSSDSTDVVSQTEFPSKSKCDDTYQDVDLESDSATDADVFDGKSDDPPLGLVDRMKQTWSSWFSKETDETEKTEDKKETELDGFQEIDAVEGFMQSQDQFMQKLGDPTDTKPERVIRSKVRAQKKKEKLQKHDDEDYNKCSLSDVGQQHSVHIPEGTVAEEKKKWETSLSESDSQSDYHQWKKCKLSEYVASESLDVHIGSLTEINALEKNKILDDTENEVLPASDEANFVDLENELAQNFKGSEVELGKHEEESLEPKQSEDPEGNCLPLKNSDQIVNSVENVGGVKGIPILTDVEFERSNTEVYEQKTDEIMEDAGTQLGSSAVNNDSLGDETCLSDCAPAMMRNPSIKNIEKGIVLNRKCHWEKEALSEIEETVSSEVPEEREPCSFNGNEGERSNDGKEISELSKDSSKEKSISGCQLSVEIKSGTVQETKLKWEQKDIELMHDVGYDCQALPNKKIADIESIADPAILERNPSIRNIEKGLVQTRKCQWEGGLPIMEEEDMEENDTITSIIPKEQVVEPAIKDKKIIHETHNRKSVPACQLSVKIKSGSVLDAKLLWEKKEAEGKCQDEVELANLQHVHETSTEKIIDNQSDTNEQSGYLKKMEPLFQVDKVVGSKHKVADLQNNSLHQTEKKISQNNENTKIVGKEDIIRSDCRMDEPAIAEGHVQNQLKVWQTIAMSNENENSVNDEGLPNLKDKLPSFGNVFSAEDRSSFENNFIAQKRKWEMFEKVSASEFEGNEEQNFTLERGSSIEMLENGKITAGKEFWDENKVTCETDANEKNEIVITSQVCCATNDTKAINISTHSEHSYSESTVDIDDNSSFKNIEKGSVKTGRDIWEQRVAGTEISNDQDKESESISGDNEDRSFGLHTHEETKKNPSPAYNLSIKIKRGCVGDAKLMWEARESDKDNQAQLQNVRESSEVKTQAVVHDNQISFDKCQESCDKEISFTDDLDASPSRLAGKGLVKEGLRKWNTTESSDEYTQWKKGQSGSFFEQVLDNVPSQRVSEELLQHDSEIKEISETESAVQIDREVLNMAKNNSEAKQLSESELSSDTCVAKDSGSWIKVHENSYPSFQDVFDRYNDHIFTENTKLTNMHRFSLEVNCGSETQSFDESECILKIEDNAEVHTEKRSIFENEHVADKRDGKGDIAENETLADKGGEKERKSSITECMGCVTSGKKVWEETNFSGVDVLEWKMQKDLVFSEQNSELMSNMKKHMEKSAEMPDEEKHQQLTSEAEVQSKGKINRNLSIEIEGGTVSASRSIWESKHTTSAKETVVIKRISQKDQELHESQQNELFDKGMVGTERNAEYFDLKNVQGMNDDLNLGENKQTNNSQVIQKDSNDVFQDDIKNNIQDESNIVFQDYSDVLVQDDSYEVIQDDSSNVVCDDNASSNISHHECSNAIYDNSDFAFQNDGCYVIQSDSSRNMVDNLDYISSPVKEEPLDNVIHLTSSMTCNNDEATSKNLSISSMSVATSSSSVLSGFTHTNRSQYACKKAFHDAMLSADESDMTSEKGQHSDCFSPTDSETIDVFVDCVDIEMSKPTCETDAASTATLMLENSDRILTEIPTKISVSIENSKLDDQVLLCENTDPQLKVSRPEVPPRPSKSLVAQKKEFWNEQIAKKEINKHDEGEQSCAQKNDKEASDAEKDSELCTLKISETSNLIPLPATGLQESSAGVDTFDESMNEDRQSPPLPTGLVSQIRGIWDSMFSRKELEDTERELPLKFDCSSNENVHKELAKEYKCESKISESECQNLDKDSRVTDDSSSTAVIKSDCDESQISSDSGVFTKSLVAQKKGFWDDFIAKREKVNEESQTIISKTCKIKENFVGQEMAIVSLKSQEGDYKYPENSYSEIVSSKTTLGRKLSITIKKGTVQATHQIFENAIENEYTKWKNHRNDKGQKCKTYKSSVGSQSKIKTEAHSFVGQNKMTNIVSSEEKTGLFENLRVRSISPQSVSSNQEHETSTDEEENTLKVKRKTSIKIQKGLVQQYKNHWEKRSNKTGFWTWKRQRPQISQVKSSSHHSLSSNFKNKRPPKISSSYVGNKLSPQRIPVSVGRECLEQERYRTSTPLSTPERPLTPEETDEYLQGVRGKVAQERKRFDSLGSIISTGSVGSLDSLDDKLDCVPNFHKPKQKSHLNQDYIDSVVGKVNKHRNMWEAKCEKNQKVIGFSKIKEKQKVSSYRGKAGSPAKKKLSVSSLDFKEFSDSDSSSMRSHRRQEHLVYILHSTINGDLVLETPDDQYFNKPVSHYENKPEMSLTYTNIKNIKEKMVSLSDHAERPKPARRKSKSCQQGTKSLEFSQGHFERDTADLVVTASGKHTGNTENLENYSLPVPDVNMELMLSPKDPESLQSQEYEKQDKNICNSKDDVVLTDADYYREYKDSFFSARTFFEKGLRENADSECKENLAKLKHRHRPVVSPLSDITNMKSNYNEDAVSEHPAIHITPEDHSYTNIPIIAPSGNMNSFSSPVNHSFVSASDATDEEMEDKTEIEVKMLMSHLVDHSCQTDDEFDDMPSHRHSYKYKEQLQNEKENLRLTSPSCDQEIQVSVYDLINPLKRHMPHESRHYDILEMPKLKRRIYKRRQVSPALVKSRSLSSCDSLSHTSNETPQNDNEIECPSNERIKSSWVNRIKYGEFGITNPSPLVASLMDLARDLPSAYPDGQQEPQNTDDLADLDHEVFQHFPEGEVIETLSGCYRGEFPHIPVTGHTGNARVQRNGCQDLISLRELRRASLPGFLALLPTFEAEEESSVHVIRNPFQPIDPITAHMMKSDVNSSENIYSHYSSNESVDVSMNSDIQKVYIDADVEDTEVSISSLVTSEITDDRSTEETYHVHDDTEKDQADRAQEYVVEKSQKCVCRAFGKGLYRGKVSSVNSFVLDTAGAEEGEVTVKVEGPFEGSVLTTEVYPLEEMPGAYQVQYKVSVPAHYIIIIMWSEEHLPGSPFKCLVDP